MAYSAVAHDETEVERIMSDSDLDDISSQAGSSSSLPGIRPASSSYVALLRQWLQHETVVGSSMKPQPDDRLPLVSSRMPISANQTLALLAVLAVCMLASYHAGLKAATPAALTSPSLAIAATPPPTPHIQYRIAVYTIGLGLPYMKLALDFVTSAQRYLCADRPDVRVDYFVFTNREWADWNQSESLYAADGQATLDRTRVRLIPQPKRGWPFDSDLRYEFMDNHTDEMAADALEQATGGASAFSTTPIPFTNFVWSDADNHFVAPVCDDLFGSLIATQHGRIWTGCSGQYPYEKNDSSLAYIPASFQAQQPYYTAHLYSAAADRFKHLIHTLAVNTRIDREKGIQAIVDDESHLNAYFTAHIPTAVLSRAFVYPEDLGTDQSEMLRIERLGGIRAKAIVRRNKQRADE